MQILKRLFIQLPLYIIAVLAIATIITPLLIWLATGKRLESILAESFEWIAKL